MIINTDELRRLLEEEYALHPAARLTDYYKLFYQAIYGPGHLITDNEAALSFLVAELQNFRVNQEPMMQDISFAGNDFCRVNLQVINQNLIDIMSYCDLFIRSAAIQDTVVNLRDIWSDIVDLIEEQGILEEQFKEEKKLLGSLLEGVALYSPRHSESFRIAYDPHYRLIRKEFIKDLL